MVSPDGAYDMFDYVTSLREGIMDAWSGIILAMKQGKGEPILFRSIALLTSRSSSPSTICRVNISNA